MKMQIPPRHQARPRSSAVRMSVVPDVPAAGVRPAQVGYRQCIETCRRQFTNPAEQADCIRNRCW